MFGQVSLDGKLHSAKVTAKLPPAFVMCGLLVILQGRPVAEHRRAEGARDDLASMGCPDVPVEAGLPGELGVALITFEGLLRGVSLHVARQGLLVFERGSALPAREGRPGGRVEALVNGQVVLARESLEAEVAGVPEIRGRRVRPLVSFEAVRPLEGLAAIRAHVVSRRGVSVHVRGQMFLESRGILAKFTFEQGVSGLFGLFHLLHH